MTTSQDPDEIRAEIERTRSELSSNVDTLTDTANPKHIAERQVDKVKDSARSLKEKVMGSDSSSDQGRLGDARYAAQDRAAAMGDAVSDAPNQLKQKARGNPLAAGVIAFGAGMLISSLIPSSEKEAGLISDLQENLEPLKQKATDAAKEMADNLREPAQEAAASIKSTATDAAETVKDEGMAAKDEVQGQAEESKNVVQDHQSDDSGSKPDFDWSSSDQRTVPPIN